MCEIKIRISTLCLRRLKLGLDKATGIIPMGGPAFHRMEPFVMYLNDLL